MHAFMVGKLAGLRKVGGIHLSKGADNEYREFGSGRGLSPARLPTKLLFPHIPKTAGTSLITVLGNLFGERQVHRHTQGAHPRAQLPSLLKELSRSHSVLIGHIPFHFWEPLLETAPAITVLREPTERVMSLFRFLKTQPSELTQAQLGLREGFTFEEFLTGSAPGAVNQVNNGMSFFMGSTMAGERLSIEWDPAELLDNAKTNLSRINFALVETLPERLGAWLNAWGIPIQVRIPFENSSKGFSYEFSAADRTEIIARNTLDLMLYRWAKIADSGLNPHALLAARPSKRIPVPEIPGRMGFHAVERSEIAWITEEGCGEIHCVGDGRTVNVELGLYMATENYPIEGIQLSVNNETMVPEVVSTGSQLCSLVVRNVRMNPGINSIMIRPSVFIPARDLIPDTIDKRSLSIALRHLSFG